MSDTATTTAAARGIRKTVVGEVVSDKMDKTVVVRTVNRVPHPRFRKIIKQSAKFHAHDEKNEAKAGDKVLIMETRPLSKNKRWRLVEILKH
ncbi:MAG: 30S ribosomal protein S17 [Chthoniobacterales bacterium]|jgi:small subunit ribosomal protein S17